MAHVEGERLEKAIALAKEYKKRLHVCHVSQQREIELIKSLKEQNMPITCEVTAHHLFLTDNDVDHLGPYGLMRPPLGTEKDRKALWDNLDVIDILASDHAPHTKEEKKSAHPPFGVPGIETSLPLMLTAVAEGKLSLEKLVDMTSKRPKEIFGIKDDPDTYTEVDLKESYIIDSSKLQSKSAWTPFDGVRVKGKIEKVVLRGKVIFDGEEIKGPPSGRTIQPV
jgi:carbamoyl-phosphate synthase/aspartate carbamoyltransferase/dihydroorotase